MAGRSVTFVFPKGHPHAGKTIRQGGVQFVEGKATVTSSKAEAIESVAAIVTRYHGAVVEGSAEQAAAEQHYAQLRAKAAAAPAGAAAPVGASSAALEAELAALKAQLAELAAQQQAESAKKEPQGDGKKGK